MKPGCLLATLDVTSLYTNIDHSSGLEAAREALNWSRPGPGLKPSSTSIITLLKLVLTKNNFQFNGQNFLQISGTAMGIRVAASFAFTPWVLLNQNNYIHTT